MILLRSFFFGLFTGLSALFIETLIFAFSFDITNVKTSFEFAAFGWSAIFLSACTEELCKFVALKKNPLSSKSHLLAAFSFIFFGIGFSTLETALLLTSSHEILFLAHLLPSIFGIVLVHTITALLLGFGLQRHPNNWRVWRYICLAVILHITYNIALLYT